LAIEIKIRSGNDADKPSNVNAAVLLLASDTHKLYHGNASGVPYLIKSSVAQAVIVPHTFAIAGEIKVPSGDTDFIPPFFVKVPAGQSMKLCSCRYKINSGTSVTAKLTINGSDATGFTSMSVTGTAAETDPTDITLADNDLIALVVTAVSGTPKNMSFTLFLSYEV
jgi:hypothetical protein